MSNIIAESQTGTYHYHLRKLGPEGPCYGGASGLIALCGRRVGWDTRMPLKAWGIRDHIPSYWCPECKEIHDREAGAGGVLENVE